MALFQPTYTDPKTGKRVKTAIWWYGFTYAGTRIRESAKTESKTVARLAMESRKRELELSLNSIEDRRHERVRLINDVAAAYLEDYKIRHRSHSFATYAIGHVTRHFGRQIVADIDAEAVKGYQRTRLKEKASPKTINEEVGILLRLLNEHGDAIRRVLKKHNALKLPTRKDVGRAFTAAEQGRLLTAAKAARSPVIYPALMVALNTGMRDAEIRGLTWSRIDLGRARLVVGAGKTEASTGRVIPLNSALLLESLDVYRAWFVGKFGEPKPEWFVFPWGKPWPSDPTRQMTTLKTAWRNVKKAADVTGRWHDNRHTLITALAEAGEGDQVIRDIAGHVSERMLKHYSHIREEARRNALEKVAVRAPAEAAGESAPSDPAQDAVVKESAKVKVFKSA